MRLHLGCGNVILPGFVNVDVEGNPGVDVVDDVRSLSAFPHECADLIYASHVLDHMGRHEVSATLTEWKRRLRPGGTLRVAVSDFAAVVALYQAGVPLPRLLGHIVGGHKSLHDRHGVSFDALSLGEAFEAAGLVNVRPWDWRRVDHGVFDDFSQAYEPHMAKDTGRLMSLNIEADRSQTVEHSVEAWVIGDSHAAVFAAGRVHPKYLDQKQPFFDRHGRFGVIYLGPWLAWRLADADRQIDVASALDAAIAGGGSPRPLIFTLGEIDCRTRLACEGSRAVEETVERYTSALVEIGRRSGVAVAAWDPPLPTGGPIYNQEFPARGSYPERRTAARQFSEALRRACRDKQLGFLSITEYLADGPERIHLHHYADQIHLNPDAIYALAAQEAERWLQSL